MKPNDWQAGRELDAKIAEVAGWTSGPIPEFSTDVSAAFSVSRYTWRWRFEEYNSGVRALITCITCDWWGRDAVGYAEWETMENRQAAYALAMCRAMIDADEKEKLYARDNE